MSYINAERTLRNALEDLEILAGTQVGPPDVSWQDIAGTAIVNLEVYVSYLQKCRDGEIDHPVFPAPSELLKKVVG